MCMPRSHKCQVAQEATIVSVQCERQLRLLWGLGLVIGTRELLGDDPESTWQGIQ